MEKKKPNKKEENSPSPVNHNIVFASENINQMGSYSNYVEVNQTPHDFTLTFCHILPPLSSNQLGDDITANIMARISFSSGLMEDLINALQIEYKKRKKLEKKAQVDANEKKSK